MIFLHHMQLLMNMMQNDDWLRYVVYENAVIHP